MLTGPLLLPPLVLAALLVVSGVSKVRRVEATRSAFAQLDLPRALTDSPAPRVLPWAEIVLAVALVAVPPPGAVSVAVLVLLLFVAYLGVIARALAFDHPVTCSCFGELGLGEVTRRTLVRNLLLVLLAVLTLWSATATSSVAARVVDADATIWAWLGLVVVTAVTLTATFGGTKGDRLASSPAPGPAEEELDYARQPIPFAALEDADGTSYPLTDLISEGAVLLVFISPGCGPCAEPIARLPRWATELGPVRVRAVVSVPVSAAVTAAPELEGLVLHDPRGTLGRIFGTGTPGGVLLGGDGLLAGGPVRGTDEVLEFVADIRAELVDAGVLTDGR